jgi:hypothetical protein
MTDVFYFGCIQGPGHFLWSSESQRTRAGSRGFPDDFPVEPCSLDGGLLGPMHYHGPEVEGQAAVWRGRGWTIISFWDRSVDKRGACNSSFVVRGTLSFDEAVTRAKAAFPNVWARFTFEVKEPEHA